MRARRPSTLWFALGLVLALVPVLALGPSTAGGAVGGGSAPSTGGDISPFDRPWTLDEATLPFEALPGTTTERSWGVLDGAGFRIEVPEDWNGELVVWAHGYSGWGLELGVEDPPLRRWLVEQGFAWAASSYRANGYVVAPAAADTVALAFEFAERHGEPARQYLAGYSMGGHVIGYVVEHWPDTFDGALPMCGAMGDRQLFDYLQDVGLLAQAVSGVEAPFPPPADYQETWAPLIAAGLGEPGTLAYETFAKAVEQRSGGERPGFAVAMEYWFSTLLGLAQPEPGAPAAPASNRSTLYQLDGDPAVSDAERQLNASVARVDRDEAPSDSGRLPVPTVVGAPAIPVLTLHTVGDLFVPFSMPQVYARRAVVNGASGKVVQRAIRDVGHCTFSSAELETAMADLVAWAREGRVPAGDDVLDPSVVAAADFGCRFTDTRGEDVGTVARAAFPPCPTGA